MLRRRADRRIGRPTAAGGKDLGEAARLHHEAGRVAEAEAGYHAALAGFRPQPDLAWIASNLALLLWQQKRTDEAEPLLRAYLEVAPDQESLLRILGTILFEAGRDEEAEPLLRRAVAAASTRPGSFLALGRLLARTDRAGDAEMVWRLGRVQHPGEASLTVALVRALRSGERLTEALELARIGVANADGPTELLAEQGTLEYFTGDVEAAVQTLRAAEAAEVVNGTHLFALGSALGLIGADAEAAAALRRAAARFAGSAVGVARIGAAALDVARDPALAEDLARQALALEPDAYGPRLLLAVALDAQGRADEAETALAQALAVEEQVGSALSAAARWHLAGRPAAGLEALDRADRIDPDGAAAFARVLLRAVLLEEAGRLDEAAEVHHRARTIPEPGAPRSVVADANYVRFLLRTERIDEATALLRQVLDRMAPAERPEIVQEVMAYALALDSGRSDAELLERLRAALTTPQRSTGWDLGPAVAAAALRGPERAELVAAVAAVVGGRASPTTLDRWSGQPF